MSDAELVSAVAENVKPDGVKVGGDGNCYIADWQHYRCWRPLVDWTDCMKVVSKMRQLMDVGIEWESGLPFYIMIGKYVVRADSDDETAQRRAILQAALLAIGDKP